MKKIEYIAPEVQVIALKSKTAFLSASDGTTAPGTGDADDL